MSCRASVVIAAYNMAEYLPRAIDSALAQLPPGGAVEVIVVDDGSVDATPEVIAAYGDQIRSVRQPNRGTNWAVEHGIELAQGEFIGLLDADDEWPRDRLLRQVAKLEANPRLGLVHGDMEVIDAAGATVHPSFFASHPLSRPTGRILGPLLETNFVSGGASTFRAALRPAFLPMVPQAAYHDWTMAACIACVAEIDLAEGIGNRYRFHGRNDSLGRPESEAARVARREIEWRRWMHRNLLNDTTVTAEFVARAFGYTRSGLVAAVAGEPAGPRALLEPDPAAKEAALGRLPPAGLGAARSKALLRALAEDPFDGALEIALSLALRVEAALPPVPVDEPLITCTTAGMALAWLEEVLAHPELVRAFVDEHPGGAPLAILAPPRADLQPLIELFDGDPVLSSDVCEVQVIGEPQTTPAQAFLRSRAVSLLTCRPAPVAYAQIELDAATERVGRPSGRALTSA